MENNNMVKIKLYGIDFKWLMEKEGVTVEELAKRSDMPEDLIRGFMTLKLEIPAYTINYLASFIGYTLSFQKN